MIIKIMIPQKNPDGLGKTRLTLVSHLDYLRLFIRLDTFELLTEACVYGMGTQYLFDDRPWSPGGGHLYYENSVISTVGVRGGWSHDSISNTYELCLDFSGEFFERKSNVDVWRMVRGYYYTFNARCSRIDIAVDDYTYNMIPVDDIIKETINGNVFGFRNYKFIVSSNTGRKPSTNSTKKPNFINTQILNISGSSCQIDSDATFYLGSRNSGKMVRIYDHDKECLRFEVEYKRKYAPQVFEALASVEWGDKYQFMSKEDEWNVERFDSMDASLNAIADMRGSKDEHEMQLSKFLGGVAITAVDFRDKNNVKNRAKASIRDTCRFCWWEKFIENIGFQLKVKIPKRTVKTIERSIAWVQKQVAPTLAMLQQCMGAKAYLQFMNSVYSQGRSRLSNYQLFLIKEYRNFLQT